MITAHLDTSSLFQLCRVNRFFRSFAQPRLVSHAQQITMRLWIHQPHMVSHKPLDFRWSSFDIQSNKMIFEPQDPAASMTLQSALPPPQIDGCTILIKISNTRRIYSISYKNRVVTVPIEENASRTAGYQPPLCPGDGGSTAYDCAWNFSYHVSSDTVHRLTPVSFECDTGLLDPEVLISSSREKVVVSSPPSESTAQEKTQEELQHDSRKKAAMAASSSQSASALSPSSLPPYLSQITIYAYDTITSLFHALHA